MDQAILTCLTKIEKEMTAARREMFYIRAALETMAYEPNVLAMIEKDRRKEKQPEEIE